MDTTGQSICVGVDFDGFGSNTTRPLTLARRLLFSLVNRVDSFGQEGITMDRRNFQNDTQLESVQLNLPVRAIIENKLLSMSTESIYQSGLYLRSTEYVKPLSSFQILLWLPEDSSPLFAKVTTSFVEGRADGYGIGVQLDSLTESDERRYMLFVADAHSSNPASYSATFRLGKFLQRQQVVSFRGALIDRVKSALTRLAVQVHERAQASDIVADAGDGKVDLVVMEMSKESLTLARALVKLPTAPQVLLLSRDGSPVALSQGLLAGATSVCALPCNQRILVSRILELLQDTEAAQQALSLPPQTESHSRHSLLSAVSQPLASMWAQVRGLFATGSTSRALQRSSLQ